VRGLEILGEVLEQAGLRLGVVRRRALLAVTGRLLWLRVRGIKFKERPPASIPVEQARLLDLLWSVNTGLGVVDTLRADDFLLRFLLLALKAGDIRRVAQGLGVLAGQLAALGRSHLDWPFAWCRRPRCWRADHPTRPPLGWRACARPWCATSRASSTPWPTNSPRSSSTCSPTVSTWAGS